MTNSDDVWDVVQRNFTNFFKGFINIFYTLIFSKILQNNFFFFFEYFTKNLIFEIPLEIVSKKLLHAHERNVLPHFNICKVLRLIKQAVCWLRENDNNKRNNSLNQNGVFSVAKVFFRAGEITLCDNLISIIMNGVCHGLVQMHTSLLF